MNIFSYFGEIFVKNEDANKKIDETTGKGKTLGTSFGDVAGNIAKGFATVAVAVGTAAVAAGKAAFDLAKNTADITSAINDNSQKLGISTTAYQEWDYVLSQNGGNIESLKTGMKTLTAALDDLGGASGNATVNAEKLSSAQAAAEKAAVSVSQAQLKYNDAVSKYGANSSQAQNAAMNLEKAEISLADAKIKVTAASQPEAAKLSEAGMALSKIGVSAVDASGKLRDQESVFKDVVKALQGMEDGTEKARLASVLFGKQGLELLPVLNMSAASTDEMIEKAHELGIVLSEETVQAGDQLGDTLEDVQKALGALKTNLGAAVMPIVQKFADFLLDRMPQIKAMFDKLAPVITKLFETLLPILFDMVDELLPIISELLDAILPVVTELFQSLGPVILDLFKTLMPIITDLVKELMPILKPILEALSPILKAIMDAIKPILDAVMAILKPLLDVIGDALKPLLDAILPPLTKALEVFSPMLEKLMPVIEMVSEIIGDVFGAAFEALTPIIDSLMQALDGLITFLTGVFAGDWEMAWMGLVDIFEGIMNIFPAILEGVINLIISGMNGLIRLMNKALGKDVLPEIGKISIPRLDFDSFGQPIGQGIQMAPENTPLPTPVKGSTNNPPLMAKGGDIEEAGAAIVGEKGPELLNLPQGARVTPLDKATGTNITIEINNAKFMRPEDIDEYADLLTKRLKQLGVATA